MKWFYNLKIAAKLLIGFILIALISGVVGGFGIVSLTDMDKSYTVMYEENTKPLGNMAIIGSQFQQTRILARDVVINPDNAKEYRDRAEEFNAEISKNIEEYKGGVSSSVEEKELDTLLVLMDKLKPLTDEVVNLTSEGLLEEARKLLFEQADPVAEEVEAQINILLNFNIAEGSQISNDNTELANSAIALMIAIVSVAVFISIVLGIFISRIISKPVKKMVEAADKLALGDLNITDEIHSKDEIGKLAESFRNLIASTREQAKAAERLADGDLTAEVAVRSENDLLGKSLVQLIDGLNEIMASIAAASGQVAAGSKQVSDSSMALSQGATEQASSIEQLTASIEEISSQTKLNTQNANQANELAETAKSNATRGNDQMKEMVKAIEEINESSTNISKIIKVIDDIAFQTNMLALNAAVEAARAGQHGKGFAVVAEEVKNLAARSGNAAKETTEMIEGSIRKTEVGTKIAKDTAEALSNIVASIEKEANLVNDIAIASNEQYAGISQINQGIMQVSQVVQNNSATSEESAAASEELSSQANMLQELVSKFKLKNNTKTYSKMEELNPEVLKMLENMSQKGKTNVYDNSYKEAAVNKSKIVLSDKEFGKY